MSRLPLDPALPQLAQALDPQHMATVFGAALADHEVHSCVIDRIKYRPGRNCTVSYVLRLRGARHRHDVVQRVAARFCHGGDSARRYQAAQGRPTEPSAAGPALQHLPALDMLVHWLPNDARLTALSLLADDARLRTECLGAVVAALTGGRGRLLDHHTTLVQYVPESRACARVDLAIQRDPGAMAEFETVYAKTDAQGGGARSHAAMRSLCHSPAHAGGRLATPASLLWQPAAGLHWQAAVPGRVLLEADPAVGPALSARVGAALAALHGTPVAGLPIVTAALLQRQVGDVAALLGQVEPAWRPQLAALVERLQRGAAGAAGEPGATLHGDLHPRNLLVDGPTLSVIDLDGLRHGPAALELGAWVADALYRAVQAGQAQPAAAPAWRAFLTAYAEASGRRIDERLLAWGVAHHLLCQRAYRGVVNLKPGRFEAVPALLALASAIAEAESVEAAMAVTLPSGVPPPPAPAPSPRSLQ